jgi:hypothetical protein
MELRDQIVGNCARAQRDWNAALVGLLDEARELEKALAFVACIGQRAAHEIDVADLGLVDHGV